MQYRTLGRTGISVSEIGLGTEYLNGQSSETVSSVIHKAADRGINYMDILFSFPEDTPAETVMHKVRVEMEDLIGAQSRIGGQWLVVSNEVGLGLVPPYPQGRIYRDVLGRANQILAQAASRVILMVAGIPMVVK